MRDTDVEAVGRTLRSGWLTQGPRTAEFEEAFAAHLQVRHAVALSSCTAALHLAYLAAGVGPGDEVIVPAVTFVASAAAVRYCGATPVFADIIGVRNIGLDPADVRRRLTYRTKAVCAVHYAGYAAPVEDLRAVCDEHGIALIEDAAHSPSATVPGSVRKLGTVGLAGAFSFFSNKVLSCGEGGLLATDDDSVAALARQLRSHATTTDSWERHRRPVPSYDVIGLGYNYRLDEARAALLLSRLSGLEDDIARRRRIVHRYRALLGDVPGVLVPYTHDQVDASSCYLMSIVVDEPRLRDPLRAFMDRRGIQTSVHYPAVPELAAYRAAAGAPVPHSLRVARSEISVPLYPHLSERDQDRVASAVRDGLAELR